MNVSRMNTRLKRLELISPPRDAMHGTLEELCRAIWRLDRAGYLKMAQEPGEYILRPWIPVFEAEETRRQENPANGPGA